MTRRWLPHPLMSLTLTLVWLLLVNRVGLGDLLLGALLGIVIPRLTSAFWPERPRLKRPALLLLYLGRLMGDILVANVQVARLVLGPPGRLRPAFVRLPVDLTDEVAITVLASTISLTPGTVSADLSHDRRTILIHSLDVADPDALRRHLKIRYEVLLKEMLE